MGGVSYTKPAAPTGPSAVLQWGPPGMGGVRWGMMRSGSRTATHFNGDLPEWEV